MCLIGSSLIPSSQIANLRQAYMFGIKKSILFPRGPLFLPCQNQRADVMSSNCMEKRKLWKFCEHICCFLKGPKSNFCWRQPFGTFLLIPLQNFSNSYGYSTSRAMTPPKWIFLADPWAAYREALRQVGMVGWTWEDLITRTLATVFFGLILSPIVRLLHSLLELLLSKSDPDGEPINHIILKRILRLEAFSYEIFIQCWSFHISLL